MHYNFSYKEMENAVLLAADLFSRIYVTEHRDDCQTTAAIIIREAVEMERWLQNDEISSDEYLDRLDEWERKMEHRYGLTHEEPEQPKPWEFDEQAFIDRYVTKAGGNDELGYIDDICKLLDGEAEPGDAASTGGYANMSTTELRAELKRLTRQVLHDGIDEYVDENYMD